MAAYSQVWFIVQKQVLRTTVFLNKWYIVNNPPAPQKRKRDNYDRAEDSHPSDVNDVNDVRHKIHSVEAAEKLGQVKFIDLFERN